MSNLSDAKKRLYLKKNEKRDFFARYRVRVVQEHYKRRFFTLFENRCFRCGVHEAPTWVWAPSLLCMDHHIPYSLGGRFEPGNLVSLCRACNAQKRDKPPDIFYPESTLDRLAPLLAQQIDLLAFEWDECRWRNDPPGYLASIGIPSDQIHATFNNEHFHGYIHPDDIAPEFFGITLRVSGIDALLKNED